MRRVVGLLGVVGFLAVGCPAESNDGTDNGATDLAGGSETWTPGQYTVDCSDGMCVVPAGPFMMGCDKTTDAACNPREEPRHQVTVPAFRIDRTEVTVLQYSGCVTAGNCKAPVATGLYANCTWGAAGKDQHPVNCLDWTQAKTYCEWAGKRLCSEAEWEKAARGTDERLYPWGNEAPTCDRTVMNELGGPVGPNDGCGTGWTMAVGSKPAGASPYGVMDLAGNVWEWVQDWFHDGYAGAPADGTAWEEQVNNDRVSRGGDLETTDARDLRAWTRLAEGPADAYNGLGVRCCKAP